MKVDCLCPELLFEADIEHYSPERPAPICHNHDDPRFSDPGDHEECEYRLFYIFMGEDSKLTRKELSKENAEHFIEMVYKMLDQEVRESAREQFNDLGHGEL